MSSFASEFHSEEEKKPLEKHYPGLSILPERSDNQIKINIYTEEENILEVLSGVDHRNKRTQIKARKHKLNFDEHLHSVKRERIEAEDVCIAILTS